MLAPIVYDLCGWPLYHGERDDSEACLCGWWNYLACGAYLDDGGFASWEFWQAGDRLVADPAPLERT